MKVKSHLIKEFSEFNLQRMNPDSVQPAAHVDNPALSTNAFDKHEDIIRQAISKLGQFQGALMGTAAYRSLKSKLSLEKQELQNLKIVRIVKDENYKYDVYITLKIDDFEYWGVIKDIMGNTDFKSEVFKDIDLMQTKEWVIKIKGLIIKNIKAFLKPQFGKFRLINDRIICYSLINGGMLEMKKGVEIEVLKAYDDKIIFTYENDKYSLTGDNFIYFNWWFEMISE